MHIIFFVPGQVVVKNDFDVVDINPAGSNVGRDEEFETWVPEFSHYLFPLSLAHVAVDTISGIAACDELVGQVAYHLLRVTKDDAELEIMQINESGQSLGLGSAANLVVSLFNRGEGQDFVFNPNCLRIAAGLIDQVHDRLSHRSREADKLAF